MLCPPSILPVTGAMEPGEKFQVKHDKSFQICKTRAERRQRRLVPPALLGQGVELAGEGGLCKTLGKLLQLWKGSTKVG